MGRAMGKLNCRQAEVEEITHFNPAYQLHYEAERKRVTELAQDAAYVLFMSRADLDQLRSREPGAYSASWDEGGQPPFRFFNAYVGKQVVGVADLMTQDKGAWAGWPIVEPIYVIPDCWKHGVGRKLWARCAEVARRDGAPGLHVCSLNQNEIARKFYEHTLGLTKVSDESLTIGQHVFPATRYEVPNLGDAIGPGEGLSGASSLVGRHPIVR